MTLLFLLNLDFAWGGASTAPTETGQGNSNIGQYYRTRRWWDN